MNFQIFHYYTQINQQRDRIIRMQQLTYEFFSLFFFFFSSSSTLPSSFLFFLFFLSFRVSLFICLLLVCSCFFFSVFLLLSIPAFFLVLLVDVMLWCLKTVVYGNQSLKNSAGTSTKSDKCCIVIYTFIQHHNDTIPKTDAWRITHEGRRMKKR